MVIQIRCIIPKLTFSQRKLNAKFFKLFFLVKEAVRFSVLQISKILNTDTNIIFPIPFKLMCISIHNIYSLRKFRSKLILLLVCSEPNNFPQQMLFLTKSISRNFMLNTMMENESKYFASVSIPYLILFIMKLIAQIKIPFFSKLKLYV